MKAKYILILLMMLMAKARIHAHTEIVGNVLFEKVQSKLYATVTLEKRHLVLGLQREVSCDPREMLTRCAGEYFLSKVDFTVNGCQVALDQYNMEMTQHSVVLSFEVKGEFPSVKSIEVESEYMLRYNEHAVFQAMFNVDDEPRSFNLTSARQEIKASFI